MARQFRIPTDYDWIFALAAKEGKTPVCLDIILQRYIQAAAKAAGINNPVPMKNERAQEHIGSLFVVPKAS